jgi:multicomponent Na+:H+ antiporter subunit D
VNALVPLVVTLPLLGAAIALIAGRHRRVQVGVSIATLTVVLAISLVMLVKVDTGGKWAAGRCRSGSSFTSTASPPCCW